ncbi:response regulator [Desulfococcus sp.]|jgi:CheY-like chemotaxis protein|uniref:response regulator n=1 Tax=Desulfococcus sp. TaxID=2025834 RepID=UPI003D0C7EBE
MVSGDGIDDKRQRRVLVVDDDQPIQKLFIHAFPQYAVQAFGSAEAALEALGTAEFDVMFVDINLPGMDGFAFAKQVRKDHPDAFIIGMTGAANKFEFSECRAAGFDAYFYKPINIKTIKQLLADRLGEG